MEWRDIQDVILTTRLIQAKTGEPVLITLHPIAESTLKQARKKAEVAGNDSHYVFSLPTADGANKILNEWVHSTGIRKHITWSCARLSFSILFQHKNVDDATVAYLLGHTTTEQVRRTYKRHRPKDQMQVVKQLPSPEEMSLTYSTKEKDYRE